MAKEEFLALLAGPEVREASVAIVRTGLRTGAGRRFGKRSPA
jgi:hypothetical protein